MNPYRLPDTVLESLLHDDSPCGDATTFALGIGQRAGRLTFRARQAMVLCGSEEARRLGELRDLQLTGALRESGSVLAAGDTILCLEGAAADLHVVWKTAQTLMEYLSGIASSTADIVAAARRGHAQAAVVCSRKNFPGTKAAAIKAVLCGGAVPHRLGLSETLLVFPEHRIFLDGEELARTIARLHRQWPERRVIVETSSEDDARLLIDSGADIVQLEKMPIDAVARMSAYAIGSGQRAEIAAAGGISAGNAQDYARAGALTLVTSAPYCAAPRDVAVSIEALGA